MLLYIDPRAVVSLLNETIGNLNWQSEFYEVNGQTIGRIGIYDEDKNQWVWKSDTGSESNIEAEKGLISDIYKRVMSRWGVCELYSRIVMHYMSVYYDFTGVPCGTPVKSYRVDFQMVGYLDSDVACEGYSLFCVAVDDESGYERLGCILDCKVKADRQRSRTVKLHGLSAEIA